MAVLQAVTYSVVSGFGVGSLLEAGRDALYFKVTGDGIHGMSILGKRRWRWMVGRLVVTQAWTVSVLPVKG